MYWMYYVFNINKRLLWLWGAWMHTAKKLPAVLFAFSKRHACSDSAPLSWVWGHCSVTLSFELNHLHMTSNLAHVLCSEFPWDSCSCLENCCLLRRWDGPVGQGSFSESHDGELQSGGLLIPEQQLSEVSWKKSTRITLLEYLKGSEKAFQSQVQFVLNKSCLSSSIKSTCTVYSQYLYKVLPASKQTNHISTLPHRMHLNLMSEETKEKTRSKSRTSVKEK